MRIRQGVTAWLGNVANRPHDRYRSWEHCYHYFQRNKRDGIASDPDHAALHLGFYLASWGMYRGSAFLLQHAYTVHLGVVDVLTSPKFARLWETEFGSEVNGLALVPLILEATNEIRAAYEEFGIATDTLVTKVLLGTLACSPACDRYFVSGFRSQGLKFSWVNGRFVASVFEFCHKHLAELRNEQKRIKRSTGVYYPLMKLVDMYFNGIGIQLDGR